MLTATTPISQRTLKGTLRHFAKRYISTRRASGELRTRLIAAVHEKARWVEMMERGDHRVQAERELAQIEHVKGTLERSSRASTERMRALEAVIAAVVSEAMREGAVRAVQPVQPAQGAGSRGLLKRPDASVRGGWSPPERP